MSRETCPHCGAIIDASRTVCPNCRIAITRKSRVIPYLIIACIAVVAVIGAVVFLLLPSPQPAPVAVPQPTLTMPVAAALAVTLPAAAEVGPSPSCTIAITGSRTPPDTIRLQVMTSTCFAGDVTGLRVRINGEEKGTHDPGPGSSGTFTGTSGSSSVVVVADFSNGAESVVYQNAAL